VKTRGTVVVDNKRVKVEQKKFFGDGEEQSGYENDVGGNQMGLAEMNEGPKNHKVCIDEELRKWGAVVK